VAVFGDDLHDLWDDIAGALDPHEVPFSNILPFQLLSIVKCSP
jgi:hypothetical protein